LIVRPALFGDLSPGDTLSRVLLALAWGDPIVKSIRRTPILACFVGASAAFGLFGPWAIGVPAATVTFQQGANTALLGVTAYAGTDDAMLIQWYTNGNFGGRADFDVGQNGASVAHSLIRFDLSALHDRVETINSVTLRLSETAASYSPAGSGTVELYQLAAANTGWIEGTSSGGTPATGWVTWNNRAEATSPWAGSAGASTAGVDYVNTLLASAPYTTSTTGTFDLTLSGDLSFVKSWAQGGTNAGFYLKEATGASTNRINFYSSENGTAANRPMLIIDYTPRQPGYVQQGMIGHWHFDQPAGNTQAYDSVNANSAALTGMDATTDWTSGAIGNALDFDGSNDQATASVGQAAGATELTMSIWAKRAAGNQDHAGLWIHRVGTSADVTGFNVAVNSSNKVQFRIMGTGLDSPNGDFPADGQWHHLVGTWKAGQFMRLYIDGDLVSSSTVAPSGGLTASDLWRFGFDPAASTRYFAGQLDDGALWSRALSQMEVQWLYESGLKGLDAALATVPEPGSFVLLALGGFAGLLVFGRRKNRARG
jgi:hypothetical protein